MVTTVPLQFTVIDSDSGESITGTVYGRGEDPTDKGVYKAYTGGQKYFLQKLFLLSTGDDPERDSPADKPAPVSATKGLPAKPDQMLAISTLLDAREVDAAKFKKITDHVREGISYDEAAGTILWLERQPETVA